MLDGQQKSERAKEEVEQGPYKIHIPYHTIEENRGGSRRGGRSWAGSIQDPYQTTPYHTIEIEDVHTLPSGSGRRSGGGSIHRPRTPYKAARAGCAHRRWNPQPLQSEPTGFSDTNDIHNMKTSKICIFVCGLPVGPTTTTKAVWANWLRWQQVAESDINDKI